MAPLLCSEEPHGAPHTSADFRQALSQLRVVHSRLSLSQDAQHLPTGDPRRSDENKFLSHTVYELQEETNSIRGMWQDDVARLEREVFSLRAATARAQAGAPWAPVAEPSMDTYKELERVEIVLQHERQRTASLIEEREAREEAHTRDIGALEGMLEQVMSENNDLKTENARLQALVAAEMLAYPVKPDLIGQICPPSPSESVQEPEMEHSVRSLDLDRCNMNSCTNP